MLYKSKGREHTFTVFIGNIPCISGPTQFKPCCSRVSCMCKPVCSPGLVPLPHLYFWSTSDPWQALSACLSKWIKRVWLLTFFWCAQRSLLFFSLSVGPWLSFTWHRMCILNLFLIGDLQCYYWLFTGLWWLCLTVHMSPTMYTISLLPAPPSPSVTAGYHQAFLESSEKYWKTFDFGMFSLMENRSQELPKEAHLCFIAPDLSCEGPCRQPGANYLGWNHI